jgi:RNA polymerase sigma-70 factor (ECF subfamily)
MVGEIFRIAFEKRNTYDLDRPTARPWLYGIATNLLAKHRRREARRLQAVARLAAHRLPHVDLAEGVSGAVDAEDLWPRVADAVTALPEPERDALVLHVWEGLSYEEVADALGVPIGTVRSRLNRARGRIRELADSSGREENDNIESRDPGRIGS